METTGVKEEATNGNNGGASKLTFKPKFAPKFPTKTEAEPAAAPATSTTVSAPNVPRHDRKGGRLQRNSDKGRTGGRAPSQAGRGQWSMPMGTSFFTGNSSSQASKTRTVVIGGGMNIKKENASNAARVARPNESIDNADEEPLAAGGISHNNLAYNEESDSDASTNGAGHGREDGGEVWPPLNPDPLAPVQLPLGPSTTALRRLLAAQPILADPSDAEALEREESTSLFLIQMPSDLRFSSILKSTNSSSSAETNSKKNKISSARLGKMQLLKSGKVRMVTDDGKVYEVSSGLAASFQHCLMSINCPAEATATNASTQGSLCVMGNITKKLVITPTMEDYMETLQSQKSSSTAHLQPLDVEDVDGEGEEGGMVVDVNDN